MSPKPNSLAVLECRHPAWHVTKIGPAVSTIITPRETLTLPVYFK